MSRNIKKEMFQPTTECIDSLVIDDIVGQAVLLARSTKLSSRWYVIAWNSVPPETKTTSLTLGQFSINSAGRLFP